MNKPFIFLSILLGFMLFGCPGPSTGSGSFNPISWNSGLIFYNTTNLTAFDSIQLPDPKAVHVYSINTTYGATLINNSNTLNATKQKNCSSTFGGGTMGATGNYSNTSTIFVNDTSNNTITVNLNTTYRNVTLDNVTVLYGNVTGENVSVFLNGVKIGLLVNTTNETTFSILGNYLTKGINTVRFVNGGNGNKSNVTYVSVSYVEGSLTCSDSDTIGDSQYAVVYENSSIDGRLILSITNATLNSSKNFNISIQGGDISVVKSTGYTYIYLLTKYGYVDTFSDAYYLPWNTTGLVNFTNMSTSLYADNGSVTVYFIHKAAGNISNYGAAVDYMGLQFNYNTTGTSAMTANVTMQGSLDCQNWVDMLHLTNVGSPVMGTLSNGTYGCIRFNVTQAAMNASDSMRIRYVGTG